MLAYLRTVPNPPPNVETWSALLRNGLECQRTGRFDEAEECFVRAHHLAPKQPEVCYALGRAKLRAASDDRDALDEAEALLRLAWERDPTLVSAAGNLARCLGLHAKRYREAHELLDQAVAYHGSLALLEVIRSELWLAQDRTHEANEALERAFALPLTASEQNAANAALARIANRDGIECARAEQHDRALFYFKRAIHLDPDWSSPHVNLGIALARMGMRERALEAYDEAVAVDPQNPAAYENRAHLLREMGCIEAAQLDLEMALSINPKARSASVSLVALQRSIGDLDNAIENLAEALEHAPEDIDLWLELSLLFTEVGDFESAEASVRGALQIDQSHPRACAQLAALLVRDGRLREAAVLAARADAANSGPELTPSNSDPPYTGKRP